MNFKDKSVCLYDHGLFPELAVRLARDFGTVYYYTPWQISYPRHAPATIGEGLPGVTRALWFDDLVSTCDLFVFPDVHDGDRQVQLRKLGKRVWGTAAAEKIEIDRWWTKQLLRKVGLPVVKTTRIIGFDKLKAHLKPLQNKWIKMSLFRGDLETYHYHTWSDAQPWFDEFAHSVGPIHRDLEYLVEDHIDGVELAYDGYSIDGKFPKTTMFGYEVKDQGFIGKVKKYDELAEPIRRINERFAPTLKQLQYRNFLSIEFRINSTRQPYVIDPCARMGSPPGEIMMELYDNLAEILWYGAEGTVIEPKITAAYAAQVFLTSEWAKSNWLEVRFPDTIRRWVKLRNLTRRSNGSYYVIPQGSISGVGSVIALGKSVDEVVRLVTQRAEQVKGYQMEAAVGSLETAKQYIEEGKAVGISW